MPLFIHVEVFRSTLMLQQTAVNPESNNLSSIVYGGTSAPAHPHIQYYLWYQIRAQNSKFYILAISWKLYAGKFLETI